jgi:hypothetical protein
VSPQELQLVAPGDLLLDPTNPRLAGHHFRSEEQSVILAWLWKNKSVNELVDSIASSGYWPHEELFAAREEDRLVVVEGNRRLAAAKLLTQPDLAASLKIEVPQDLSDSVRESLKRLPVLVKSRKEIWQFIGFKHVNGSQEWDSIAKAQYIHRVHEQFQVPLDEISRSIGDRHETVLRLYSGYLVLEQARLEAGFEPDDVAARRLPFSHLTTALGYSSVRAFLGVDAESLRLPHPVPPQNLDNLKSLMLWLYGSRSQERDPRVRRQNPDLRDLAKALEVPEGIRILRADLPLELARDASLGDERLFQDAITVAERALRDAKKFVPTGYSGDESLLKTAMDVDRLARSLLKEMRDISNNEIE